MIVQIGPSGPGFAIARVMLSWFGTSQFERAMDDLYPVLQPADPRTTLERLLGAEHMLTCPRAADHD